MKHAISSVEFILQMKGFRDGAYRKPMDPAHSDCKEYNSGYVDGQNAARGYSHALCEKLGLQDPVVHT